VKRGDDPYEAVALWLGITLDRGQRNLLRRFEQWLEGEAESGGGIGPHEAERLFDRHIADSLAFLKDFPVDVKTVIDVGGGVGLPSIPMAVARPDIEFTLVDRSRRRTDLAIRAVRILGLNNLSIETRDASDVSETFDVTTFRASLPILQAAEVFRRCGKPLGTGLFAVSRQHEVPSIPSAPHGITFALSSEGGRILDSPFWLLRMRHI
jgi:16S rRNA (guanine527-N7)-methyltransferase